MTITLEINAKINVELGGLTHSEHNRRWSDGGSMRDNRTSFDHGKADADINGKLSIDCDKEETLAAIELSKALQQDLDSKIENIRNDIEDLQYKIDKQVKAK